MSLSRQEEIEHKVSFLVRKYRWMVVPDVERGGYILQVDDGDKAATVRITDDEDIEKEAKRLIAEVDKHNYPDLD